MIRVMLVEDEWTWASAVAFQLGAAKGIEFLGTATTAEEAVVLARKSPPDVVLIDLLLQDDESGLYAARRLRLRGVGARLVILTVEPSLTAEVRTRELGLDGFVAKAELETAASLVDLVRTVGSGVQAFGGRFNAQVNEGLNGARAFALTIRELEIIDLLVQGFSTNEIAETLGVARQSVFNRIGDIGKKLGVRGRGRIVARALRDGFAIVPASRGSSSLSADPPPRAGDDRVGPTTSRNATAGTAGPGERV